MSRRRTRQFLLHYRHYVRSGLLLLSSLSSCVTISYFQIAIGHFDLGFFQAGVVEPRMTGTFVPFHLTEQQVVYTCSYAARFAGRASDSVPTAPAPRAHSYESD